MGEISTFLQCSLLMLSQPQHRISRQRHLAISRSQSSFSMASTLCSFSASRMPFPSFTGQKECYWKTRAGVVSDSKVPTTFTVDSAGEGIDVLPDSGGSDDNLGGAGGGGGGGGGDGGNHNDNDNEEGMGGDGDQNGSHKKQPGMLMSQKVTLAYAALVGVGGVMGYLKGGSRKSLIAGGGSACLLYCVFTLLPSHAAVASSIGLALSATLVGVMGSRFKRSGKIFPAGVVSLVSLVMSGGYLHGILRGLH
ncbi:protein FATTY ACID EXPORT 2, chloroplastic-like isoform X1 [Andrographis paniculata]|uniref:protein FATTY ACID EXPORT 2, chloroplastic-like isoform X1 n=1 Tax=Andrographis paniculata TaxID=175694 RepID=UPI0021E8DA41|nr:protein FATTY ACID EXPORT 2, chloroplastic-like isoform X1 [Andrographis paniculata]XP_051139361.1 protein FATTY ACID EXPORT 2, chloroplastic-like isoform X1 [Andrographis paniculata]